MKNLFFFCCLFIFITIISSCIPDVTDNSASFEISLSDPEIQKIIDLGDKRDIKSLYKYLRDQNAAYRYQATLIFASIKSAEANDSLLVLLNDKNMQVRSAAAYAIGQSGDVTVALKLIAAFRGKDTLGVNNIFNANILEAVGKTGNV